MGRTERGLMSEQAAATCEDVQMEEPSAEASDVAQVEEEAAVVEEEAALVEEEPKEPAIEDATVESTGRRQRKEVKRFEVQEIKQVEAVVIYEGKGKRLGDITSVRERFDKFSGSTDEAKTLHKIIWGRPGQAKTLKRALHDFTGLHPDDEIMVMERAIKAPGFVLRSLCKIIGAHQGTISMMAESVVEFLKNPDGKTTSTKRKAAPKKATAPKKKAKSTPPPSKKTIVKKTENKAAPKKEAPSPAKRKEESGSEVEAPAEESSQASIFRQKVRSILDQSGEKALDLTYKSIRKQVSTDLKMKIEGDDKEMLKEITQELFHTMMKATTE